MINFTEKDDWLIFEVRVVPRASKSEIVGEFGGALKLRIASPPVDGEANAGFSYKNFPPVSRSDYLNLAV